ncbi:hypothetical protein [Burkholderia cepacia]|uniref:hypothetical protein n=1 Tax=Burkholderia cepacia TaxID=292 RepID=UPI00163B5E3C
MPARRLRPDWKRQDHRQPVPSGTGSHLDEMPLVAMPAEQAVAIVHCTFVRHLAADGVFYPFTYVPRYLEAMHIRAIRIGIAWMNFPPAVVYRFERRVDAIGRQWTDAPPQRDAVAEATILHGVDITRLRHTPSLDSSGAGPSADVRSSS